MPYIESEDRERFGTIGTPRTVGELTYCLSLPVKRYLAARGKSFQTCSEVVTALNCLALEFYRRVLGPYEDTKIEVNGDGIFE